MIDFPVKLVFLIFLLILENFLQMNDVNESPFLIPPAYISRKEALDAEEGRATLLHDTPNLVQEYVNYIETVWNVITPNRRVTLPDLEEGSWDANLDSFNLYHRIKSVDFFNTHVLTPIIDVRPTRFTDDNRAELSQRYNDILTQIVPASLTTTHRQALQDLHFIFESTPNSFRDYAQLLKPLNTVDEVDNSLDKVTKYLVKMSILTQDREECFINRIDEETDDFIYTPDNYHLSHFFEFETTRHHALTDEDTQQGILPPRHFQTYQQFVLQKAITQLGQTPEIGTILSVFQKYRDTHVHDAVLETAHLSPNIRPENDLYILNQLTVSDHENKDWTYLYAGCVASKFDAATSHYTIGYDLFLEHKAAIEERIKLQENNPALLDIIKHNYNRTRRRPLINDLNNYLTDNQNSIPINNYERDLFQKAVNSYDSPDKSFYNSFSVDIMYEAMGSDRISDFEEYIDMSIIYCKIMEQKFGRKTILSYLLNEWVNAAEQRPNLHVQETDRTRARDNGLSI
jgi:hypothetical protein